jgi:hypothetical protein
MLKVSDRRFGPSANLRGSPPPGELIGRRVDGWNPIVTNELERLPGTANIASRR